MKKILIVSLVLVLAAFILPLLALGQAPLREIFASPAEGSPAPLEPSESPPSMAPDASPTPQTLVRDADTQIRVKTGGAVEVMSLQAFLYGVVAAEMPALYPIEALKAQAVAARTFALCAREEPYHEDADICGEFSHCLAFRPLDVTAAGWDAGTSADLADKIRVAVDQTDGQVLTYEGALIEAVFFALSSGMTENASDVWSADVPYLRSVDSSWDKESPQYETTVTVRVADAKTLLQNARPGIALPGDPSQWFSAARRSDAGGVLTVTVGDTLMKGTELRSLFGLRSHNFNVSATAETLTFTVFGYGHGVGLSQFGARQMALLSDCGYEEILRWYYTGVEITAWTDGQKR